MKDWEVLLASSLFTRCKIAFRSLERRQHEEECARQEAEAQAYDPAAKDRGYRR